MTGLRHLKTHHLRTNEAAMLRFGIVPTATWVFLKMRANNGVIYSGVEQRNLDHFGWGRSTFYSRMAMLIRAKMAYKDRWGNYRLMPTIPVLGQHKGKDIRHKCTLVLKSSDDERHIRDLLRAKLAEMKHRQVLHHKLPRHVSDIAKRERVRMLEGRPESAETAKRAPWGSSHEELVRSAKEGFAPINTDRLMQATCLGRTAMFAWKRRMKILGLLEQQDRRWRIEDELVPLVKKDKEFLQKACQGVFVPGWTFHQASLYRFTGVSP